MYCAINVSAKLLLAINEDDLICISEATTPEYKEIIETKLPNFDNNDNEMKNLNSKFYFHLGVSLHINLHSIILF